MTTSSLYETVKQQTNSFMYIGCASKFKVEGIENHTKPLVTILNGKKIYKFCDPDWSVVSKQLNTLYFKLKEKYERENTR